MCWNRRECDEAGVSESIGFILIFALVTVGIGLVTLYGYPMLLQQQVNADERIMEKNMIVLQNDVKSLAYKTVPYKETSLKIGSGSLTVVDSTFSSKLSNFTIYDNNGIIATVFYPGDLRYESISAQTGISIENGAVVMRKMVETGSVMLAEPRWFYDGKTNEAVIYLIGFNSTSLMSRSGVGTVQMALGETNYTIYDIPSGDQVYVSYGPNQSANYQTAWENYFTNTMKMTRGGPNNDFILLDSSRAGHLVVKRYFIIVKSL